MLALSSASLIHRVRLHWVLVPIALFTAVISTCSAATVPTVDDHAIQIRSRRDVARTREALRRYLWGSDGFPKRLPDEVVKNISSPVQHLTNLARTDEFRFNQAPGLQGLAYHFVPERSNHEFVVVHHGHSCTLDDDPSTADVGYGLQRTINALLANGYGVLGVYMPHMRPGDCTGGHDALMQSNTVGSPLKYFLDPVAVSLNYLKAKSATDHFPAYRRFHMTGLSGGGWTTTLYAAVDPTIRCSIPVAGSLPLYLRHGSSVGDREQYEPSFYGIAGFPDLYVLGAEGRGRRQVQIVVRRDDCCFGAAQHDEKSAGMNYETALREYEGRVRSTVSGLKQGSFRLVIDESAPSHMISHFAIEKVILPELQAAR